VLPALGARPLPAGRVAFEGVLFNRAAMSITFQGCSVLPAEEIYRLAFYLFSRPDQFCPLRELLREVWGQTSESKAWQVYSAVATLRRQLTFLGCPYDIEFSADRGYRLSFTKS